MRKLLIGLLLLASAPSPSFSQKDDRVQPVPLSSLPTPIYAQYIDPIDGSRVSFLTNEALEKNRELIADRQNLIVIRGRLVQAGLRPNPSIDSEISSDKLATREGEYDFSISYIQPIELKGKRGKRIRVVQLESDQTEKEIAFKEQQLAAEIRSQYAEALAAAEILRTTEQLLALNESSLQLTQARLNEGDASKLDLNLVRVEVNRLRAQRLQAEIRVKAALMQLKTLAGLSADHPLKLRNEPFASRTPDRLNLENLTNEAMSNRSDLQAARIAETAAEARIALAEAEAVPDLDVFGKFEQERSALGESVIGRSSDTNRKVGVGVSIPLPFFNRNQGEIAVAAAQRVQARNRREFLEQIVKRDVALGLSRLSAAAEAIRLYQTEIVPGAEENLQIIRIAYDLGDQKLLDVIAEQRRLIETEMQYTETLKEYYLSIIELERATGSPIK